MTKLILTELYKENRGAVLTRKESDHQKSTSMETSSWRPQSSRCGAIHYDDCFEVKVVDHSGAGYEDIRSLSPETTDRPDWEQTKKQESSVRHHHQVRINNQWELSITVT